MGKFQRLENVKENIIENNKNSEEIDEKVTGGLFIAEAASTETKVPNSPPPERKSLPDYNFLEIFFISLLIYFGSGVSPISLSFFLNSS